MTGDSSQNASAPPQVDITNVAALMETTFSFCYTLTNFVKFIPISWQETSLAILAPAPSKMPYRLPLRNLFTVPSRTDGD